MSENPSARRAVAVLGAGPAGLASAFELARTGRYDVHVYQVGWRAGGKCATGRDPDHLRARQNGSHYLFGCYHNAFSLIREAHSIIDKLGDPKEDRFGSFATDFVSRNLLVGWQRYSSSTRDGKSEGNWFRYLPQNLEWPGEGKKFPSPFDCFFMLFQFAAGTFIDLLTTAIFFRSDSERFAGVRFFLKLFPVSPFEQGLWARFMRTVLLPVRWIFNHLVWAPIAWIVRVMVLLTVFVVPGRFWRWTRALWRNAWRGIVFVLRLVANKLLSLVLMLPASVARRGERLFILFELGLTVLVGYFRDDLNLPGHFDKIDQLDFREWLRKHGAKDATVNSALVTTWYDAVIAYERGNKQKASSSAGVCVHAILRSLLSYKGAFAYQMRAEVGDSFIAPTVRALELLGVKFHFYHRVKQVDTDLRSREVTRVVLARQSNEPSNRAEFLDVPVWKKGRVVTTRKAWPAAPLRPIESNPGDPPIDSYYSTLETGRVTLTRRTVPGDESSGDFDFVISALPIGVVDDVLVDERGQRLSAAPGSWRDCHANVHFTESQAIRIWFSVPLGPHKVRGKSLGWRHDPPILSGYKWPHSTYEDNSQAIDVHAFPDGEELHAIGTVFGPLETGPLDVRDPAHEKAQRALAEQAAVEFMNKGMLELWPGLESPHGSKQVDWSYFVDLSGGKGAVRFKWQHVSANVGPMEGYVMCFPKSLKHRLRADESGFRNLYLAGDWTRNGVDVGTVEGAVISGLKAAQAISGVEIPIVGGYDFERGTLFS